MSQISCEHGKPIDGPCAICDGPLIRYLDHGFLQEIYTRFQEQDLTQFNPQEGEKSEPMKYKLGDNIPGEEVDKALESLMAGKKRFKNFDEEKIKKLIKKRQKEQEELASLSFGTKQLEPISSFNEDDAIREIEQRIVTAFKVLRYLPDREAGYLKVKICWPEYIEEYADLIGRESLEIKKRFEPSKKDINDMDIALGWLTQIDKPISLKKIYYKIFNLRSLDFTWEAITRRIGHHVNTIKHRRQDALYAAWRIALEQEQI